MTDPDVEAALKAQKQFPNLRGVRQMLYWDSDPVRQAAAAAGSIATTPDFRRGFALLEKYDLHFELQVYAAQAQYAVELIKAFPNVPHDPGARRHAHRAHAGSDRRMARGAHGDGGVSQSACEDFRASECSATASPCRRRGR